MEWLPMCEKLEKADDERNWLDMMIVYGRQFADEHRDFALRVNRLIGDMRVACEDRGSREWQLCDLEKGPREMAFEIEPFLLKLMDEEPSHMRFFGGD
ncbi:hypothetical protein Tco_0807349 [Tanacetum coccineum]